LEFGESRSERFRVLYPNEVTSSSPGLARCAYLGVRDGTPLALGAGPLLTLAQIRQRVSKLRCRIVLPGALRRAGGAA